MNNGYGICPHVKAEGAGCSLNNNCKFPDCILDKCEGWQLRDPATGLVFPWYTKSFLDELVKWDLSDKTVFEYGAGASTIWWAMKVHRLFAVESSDLFCRAIDQKKIANLKVWHEPNPSTYPHAAFWPQLNFQFDIIIIDGIERDACVIPALQSLRHGGKLIIDNYDQPSVWVPEERTREILEAMPHKIYKQEGHPDWQTAIFIKP